MKKSVILSISITIFILCAGIANAAPKKCPLPIKLPYKTSSSATVYYITASCTKRPFANPASYLSYFKSWKTIRTTTKNKLLSIPTAKEGAIRLKNKSTATAPISQPKQSTTQITPVCGNGMVNSGEECDGGEFCNAQCKLHTLQTSQNWVNPSDLEQTREYKLKIGDKLAISTGITVRIENVTKNSVDYSIWGKDHQSHACRLISNTGTIGLPGTNSDSFREFTAGFIELTGIADNTATIKKYVGSDARSRCEQIGDWKKPIACSFYPDGKSYYISDGQFRVYFHEPAHQLAAEWVGRGLSNCLATMQKQLPALKNINSFDPLWGIYAGAYPDVKMAASSDYERISLWYNIFPANQIGKMVTYVKDGRCPIEWNVVIPHELAHILFAESVLQDSYDTIRGAIQNDTPRPWPTDLAEGLAEFFAYWGTQNIQNSVYINKTKKCLNDQLIDTNDGSTSDQRIYKNILQGRGYNSNRYDAGLCFFNRVRNDCGDNTVNFILTTTIENSGTTTYHPTLFHYMTMSCDVVKVKKIMEDYGFDSSYLNGSQKYPINDFLGGSNENGCL